MVRTEGAYANISASAKDRKHHMDATERTCIVRWSIERPAIHFGAINTAIRSWVHLVRGRFLSRTHTTHYRIEWIAHDEWRTMKSHFGLLCWPTNGGSDTERWMRVSTGSPADKSAPHTHTYIHWIVVIAMLAARLTLINIMAIAEWPPVHCQALGNGFVFRTVLHRPSSPSASFFWCIYLNRKCTQLRLSKSRCRRNAGER